MTPSQVDAAADHVQGYPFAYRKAIMGRLSEGRRAEVWRTHVTEYRASHADLPSDALPVIDALLTLMVPSTFGDAAPEVRQQTGLLARQLASLLGRDEAEYLLYRLGPKDGTFTSLAPMSHRVVEHVRGWMVALAAEAGACDCAVDFGNCSTGTCRAGADSCVVDDDWPACGWFWNDPCDGQCRSSDS